MSQGARVQSVDALRALRAALWKFAEGAKVALADAESEMQRTLTWCEMEQRTYWQNEIRKRTEAVARAKEAVRMKKLFKDSSGRIPSAVDEEKALAIAQRRLAEAEQKLINVKRSVPRLQKEIQNYKGSVQRLATSVETELPNAAAKLDSLVGSLDAYMALDSGAAASSDEATSQAGASMARAEQEQIARKEPAGEEPADQPGQPTGGEQPKDEQENPPAGA